MFQGSGNSYVELDDVLPPGYKDGKAESTNMGSATSLPKSMELKLKVCHPNLVFLFTSV